MEKVLSWIKWCLTKEDFILIDWIIFFFSINPVFLQIKLWTRTDKWFFFSYFYEACTGKEVHYRWTCTWRDIITLDMYGVTRCHLFNFFLMGKSHWEVNFFEFDFKQQTVIYWNIHLTSFERLWWYFNGRHIFMIFMLFLLIVKEEINSFCQIKFLCERWLTDLINFWVCFNFVLMFFFIFSL